MTFPVGSVCSPSRVSCDLRHRQSCKRRYCQKTAIRNVRSHRRTSASFETIVEFAPVNSVYEDPEDILAHQGLEAIVIATNTNVHSSLAVSALDRGLVSPTCLCGSMRQLILVNLLLNQHVLLEKPISTIQTEAEEVVLAAERNPQAKISIAFSRRCKHVVRIHAAYTYQSTTSFS
jgi:predicted dehydrogenase